MENVILSLRVYEVSNLFFNIAAINSHLFNLFFSDDFFPSSDRGKSWRV